MRLALFIILSFTIIFIRDRVYANTSPGRYVESLSINLQEYIDLSNLEYDDSPYPGRTNIGHIFIPFVLVHTRYFDLKLGGLYKHVYIMFDEYDSPEKLYPYLSSVFHPWGESEFVIGNFANLAPFPNTIYNEFLFFEERPFSSGLKFSIEKKSFNLLTYLDWIELDTEEHPEEFITGLIFKHNISNSLYYRFYNHYHHRGGQLNKDTHPVRIEQDVVLSPVIGLRMYGLFVEIEYYLSIFSQNFEASNYGNAVSALLGYTIDKKLELSYQCFYNYDYYHQDAHIFYLKRKNVLNRVRIDYNIFSYKRIIDFHLTVNLYGLDPPGIDFRLFARIDLNLIEYRNRDEGSYPLSIKKQEATNQELSQKDDE